MLAYRVLLYYHYTDIADPVEFSRAHLEFCRELGVRGRILVAAEGINGTISGTVEQADRYIADMAADERFADMEYKIDEVEDHVFRKLSVRPRSEIVTMALDRDVDPRVRTGKRLSPEEFYAALQHDDVIVLDARNDYEYDLGHFKGAIRPPVKTFKEFPQWIRENLGDQKDKTVLTYCTGGIRCEKFSAFLLEEGFEDVSQLHGGIVTYGKDDHVQGRLFDGRCYVFDERISVEVNRTEDAVIIGRCLHCDTPSERYVNCANLDCDTQYICCEECEVPNRRSCCEPCTDAPNHEFDPVKVGANYSFYR